MRIFYNAHGPCINILSTISYISLIPYARYVSRVRAKRSGGIIVIRSVREQLFICGISRGCPAAEYPRVLCIYLTKHVYTRALSRLPFRTQRIVMHCCAFPARRRSPVVQPPLRPNKSWMSEMLMTEMFADDISTEPLSQMHRHRRKYARYLKR